MWQLASVFAQHGRHRYASLWSVLYLGRVSTTKHASPVDSSTNSTGKYKSSIPCNSRDQRCRTDDRSIVEPHRNSAIDIRASSSFLPTPSTKLIWKWWIFQRSAMRECTLPIFYPLIPHANAAPRCLFLTWSGCCITSGIYWFDVAIINDTSGLCIECSWQVNALSCKIMTLRIRRYVKNSI